MTEVPRIIRSPLRAATYQTLIGLLAATGMRVGEALRLECGQIDWAEGVLIVHASKFGKSREVPLTPCTVQALTAYARVRDRWLPRPDSGLLRVHGRDTGGLPALRCGVPPHHPGQRRRSMFPGPPAYP
jgi:integrase